MSTINKQTIAEFIWKNKMLMDAINNVVDYKYREDFRSHFILQVMQTDEGKLIELYKRGEIDWYCLGIITNQWDSQTSSFFKEYRNNGYPNGKNVVSYVDTYIENNNLSDSIDQNDDIDCLDLTSEELEIKIKSLLLEQYNDFIENHYHKMLFELYHFDKLTLKQITDITDINKDAISRSVRKTKKWLKSKICG